MKKRFLPAVVLVMLMLGLSACGATVEAEVTPLVTVQTEVTARSFGLGEPQTVGNTVFTLFKISTTDRVASTMNPNLFYENTAEGESFVDVIFDVTNCGTEPLSSEDLIQAVATLPDGTICKNALYLLETYRNTQLAQNATLEAGESGRFHCAISVPMAGSMTKLRFTVGDSLYEIDYKLNTTVRDAVLLQVDETVTVEQYASLTFRGIEYTDDLLPKDTSGTYRHYPVADSSNTYLVVRLTLTNLQESAKRENTFVQLKAHYTDGSVYNGMLLVEDADGRGFSEYDALVPEQATDCCYLIEVPKAQTESAVEITIIFAEKEYVFRG